MGLRPEFQAAWTAGRQDRPLLSSAWFFFKAGFVWLEDGLIAVLQAVAAMQLFALSSCGMGGRGAGDGFVTGSAGLSGNALNDEPRVKKENRGRGGGRRRKQLMLN